jgi:hypothetical protein
MMQVPPVTVPRSVSPALFGRALQAGLLETVSTGTGDILELSGLSRQAASLGPEAIEALRGLAADGALTADNLSKFVDQLTQSGTQPDRIRDLLSNLSGFKTILGTTGFGDLFQEVESRGISGDLKYLDTLDSLFSLGHRDVTSLFRQGSDLSDEEFDLYLKSAAKLLQAGVVGTEVVDFRGNPTKVFIENEMGSEYARSPLWPRRFPF